jgi:putative membrane protein
MAQFGSASALGAEGPRFKSGYPDVLARHQWRVRSSVIVEPAKREVPPDPEPDPRYSLANERTFLAWLRTALAFVVAGLAAVTVDSHVRHSVFLTLVAILGCLVGAGGAVAAFVRWRQAEESLRTGRPMGQPVAGAAMVAVLVILAGAALVVVLQRIG